MASTETVTREHTDLLETLARRRFFLKFTVQGLTDEQAAQRLVPTSELCLGGLVKHVAATERGWLDFIVRGAVAMGSFEDFDPQARIDEFRMLPGETMDQIIADYDQVAADTERVVRGLSDLSVDHALPEAPWFEPGARWSARTVLVHLIGETAQHSGHADILRESLDGAKTMG